MEQGTGLLKKELLALKRTIKIRSRTVLVGFKVGSSPASDMVRLHTTWVGVAYFTSYYSVTESKCLWMVWPL